MEITFEQAMGLYENVRMTENGFSAVFEYFCNPKNRENTEIILDYWDKSDNKEVNNMINRIALERAYMKG